MRIRELLEEIGHLMHRGCRYNAWSLSKKLTLFIVEVFSVSRNQDTRYTGIYILYIPNWIFLMGEVKQN